jgi:hypothetical protein
MAPRFVEVNSPVSEGIATGLDSLSYFGGVLGGILENVTAWLPDAGRATIAALNISDTSPFVNEIVETLTRIVPRPTHDTAYLFALSSAAILAHLVYVVVRARVILRHFGSMRKVE